MRNQDEIIKFLAYDGQISITCARTTNLVEKARELQDLSPVVTAALGRLLTITCILGNKSRSKGLCLRTYCGYSLKTRRKTRCGNSSRKKWFSKCY